MSERNQSGPPSYRIPSFFVDPVARILVAIFLFAALLFRSTALSGFCLVLLLMSTGSKYWRKSGDPRVTCRFETGRLKTFPNETVHFRMEVDNGFFLPMEVRAWLRGTGEPGGVGSEDVPRTCRVGAHRSAVLQWTYTPRKRGVYALGPALTEIGDGLGFFHRPRTLGRPLELVVYPRIIPTAPFPWQAREIFGSLRTRGIVEDPVNVMGVRDYQPGRPARYIHWKSSVRLNKLQEKTFEPTRRTRILLSVDVSGFQAAGDPDAFEEMLETAGSIAVNLDQAGAAVGLITNARIHGGHAPMVPVAMGPGQMPSMLELMARMTMEKTADLSMLARHALKKTSGAGWIAFAYSEDPDAAPGGLTAQGGKVPVTLITAKRSTRPFNPPKGVDVISMDTLRRGGGEDP